MQQHKYTVERKAITKRIYAKILFIVKQTKLTNSNKSGYWLPLEWEEGLDGA